MDAPPQSEHTPPHDKKHQKHNANPTRATHTRGNTLNPTSHTQQEHTNATARKGSRPPKNPLSGEKAQIRTPQTDPLATGAPPPDHTHEQPQDLYLARKAQRARAERLAMGAKRGDDGEGANEHGG